VESGSAIIARHELRGWTMRQSDLRSEFPELVAVLRAEQSFDNALEVQRVKGWAVVKGFAVYDLHDCPEGEAYVGYRHWWNVNDDGAWCAHLSSPLLRSLHSNTSRRTRTTYGDGGFRTPGGPS
jgi:hypothetical protein